MTSFGSPSKGGKFYTGSSHSKPWVKDLLWARYCVREGKQYGLEDIKPPMMSFYRGDAAMVDKADRLPQMRESRSDDDSVRVSQLETIVQSQAKQIEQLRAALLAAQKRANRAEAAASKSNIILKKLSRAIEKKQKKKKKK